MDESSTPRIAALLRQNVPLGLCCDCLAAKLDLPKVDVRHVAQLIVMQPGFQMVRRLCYACRHTEDVLVFRGRNDDAPPSEVPSSTTAKVLCLFCRTPILPAADKTTVQGAAYHAGCWDRRSRAGKKA